MPGKPGWRAPPVTLSMETKRTFQAVCFHCDNTSKLSNLSKTVSIGEFPLKPGAKGNFKACVFRVLAGCIAWRYFVSKCVQKATRCVRWTSSPPPMCRNSAVLFPGRSEMIRAPKQYEPFFARQHLRNGTG